MEDFRTTCLQSSFFFLGGGGICVVTGSSLCVSGLFMPFEQSPIRVNIFLMLQTTKGTDAPKKISTTWNVQIRIKMQSQMALSVLKIHKRFMNGANKICYIRLKLS